jgi:hypothetical protein
MDLKETGQEWCGLDLFGSGDGLVVASFEHIYGPLGSTAVGFVIG